MRWIAGLLAAFLPLQAQALSCMVPTVEGAFAAAQASAQAYVPVLGAFNSTLPPRPPSSNPNPADRDYIAQFVGVALTPSGKDTPMKVPVTVYESCIASWCPSVPSGVEVLTFLRVEGLSYAFDITACPTAEFFHPQPAQIATMRACVTNGAC